MEVCGFRLAGASPTRSDGPVRTDHRGRTPYRGGWAPGLLRNAPLREGFPSGGSEAARDHRVQGCAERCVRGQAAGTQGAQARLGDAVLFRDGVSARPHPDATTTGLVQPARLKLPLLDPQVGKQDVVPKPAERGSGRLRHTSLLSADVRTRRLASSVSDGPGPRTTGRAVGFDQTSAASAIGAAVSSTPSVRQTRRDLREVLEPRRALAQ